MLKASQVAAPVRAESVGRPTALSSLARLLLRMHREPALHLVTTGDDDHAEHDRPHRAERVTTP
jgi:hypothetical protein